MNKTAAQRNRELMPNVADMLDELGFEELRKQFPGTKVLYAKDLGTGHSVGTPPQHDPDKVFTIPENYFPSRTYDGKMRKK